MAKIKNASREKKIFNLRKQEQKHFGDNDNKFIRTTVHNYSSYHLSKEEEKALSFGLDQHIPTSFIKTIYKQSSSLFYQSISQDINHLPEEDIINLKTKLRYTCEKYSKIKVPYKYKKVIDNLKRNENIVIMKQDKGRGVVIVDKTRYIDKCLSLLESNQFKKLNKNPTSTYEVKIQRTLRKLKSKFSREEYYKLYPTGSNAARFLWHC